MLMLIFFVSQQTLDRLGFEHNLYQYAGNPGTPLSDMNGQGDFAAYAWWFRAYWTAGAVLLGVLAYALWRRGVGAPLKVRLARVPARMHGMAGAIAAVAAIAMAGLGGWIYYNTNVLNEYRTQLDVERLTADAALRVAQDDLGRVRDDLAAGRLVCHAGFPDLLIFRCERRRAGLRPRPRSWRAVVPTRASTK